MRRRILTALALMMMLGLTSCGWIQGATGSGDGGDGTTKNAKASDEDRMREFAKCMRQNGVDMPDPQDGKMVLKNDEGPEGEKKLQAAQAKCRHLMPNGGKPPSMSPEQVAKAREHAKCMRENGIEKFPDPDGSGKIEFKGGPGSEMDPESDEFQAAQKACAKYEGGPMLSERSE
ncbi:MAG: hypothetical protein GEV11_22995 [Streptosporangiales bacterium]|nr:hypothetical protein [Streptosporangiales bacterium]